MREQDAKFVGSIPAIYEEHLGPVVFAPHARELSMRVVRALPGNAHTRLLETACGTGILTRALLDATPASCEIVATDLNGAMVEHAKRVVADPRSAARVTWRVADAMELPFPPSDFDAVACQFGWMFVPDKARAAREAARVLKPGGAFHFDVWCGLEENPFSSAANRVIASFFPKDPPTFYEVPFGFHDPRVIESMLRDAGFDAIVLEKKTLDAVSVSAAHLARGLVEGNPVVNSIREAGLAPGPIVDALAKALVAEGGNAPFRSTSRALHGSARRK